MFDSSGRRTPIAGSSTGVGVALATGLSEAGAEVVLKGRDPDRLGQAAARLRAQGAQPHAVRFDVASADDVESAIERSACDIGAAVFSRALELPRR
ncbi:SDR family NAD(P)-dependent oxidoreductase [Burkholderia pyrrocinia]|uniref:SDR family NAD(P)-dependent oxidoreductase n=1 Tax=Burkholderia pyrrocinia TaxID=60550 RepID=UPI001BCA8296|nr:SDR family NAD(P)-dependent oxidoreductase [Burkholderia pyrrocinia]QVN23811.1 SDR family NAD(P)-dependent oxidoreductase [Burkholderia pyrrocinia]